MAVHTGTCGSSSAMSTPDLFRERQGFGSTSGKDLPRLAHLYPRQYDVGVDNNDFRPVSFKEVKSKNDIQVNALSNHI